MSELNGKTPHSPIPENDGGQKGATCLLTPSELVTLRARTDRIPFSQEDRENVASTVMSTLRAAEKPRLKLAAIKTFATLERLNIQEMAIHLDNQRSDVNQQTVIIQGNADTNVLIMSAQELAKLPPDVLISKHRESIVLPQSPEHEGEA